MASYSENLLPTTTGFNLGSSSQRWDLFCQDLDIAGTFSISGRMGVKNLEGILFADQFTGATPGDQIDAAVTAAVGGLVVAPPDMGAGFGVIPGLLLDLRSGQFTIYSNGYVTPNFSLASAGIISGAFISGSTSPAGTGAVRLASTDAIKFRVGILDKTAMSFSGSTVIIGASGGGVQLPGPITFSGALSGVTTLSMSGQLASSLATGTAPLSITSTTLVPNLNVATLNGVTISGAPTSGYYLVATSASTAGWAATPVSYKLENMQYTPVTYVSSAGGILFTYTLSNNELAVGQALRIKAAGTYLNTSVATRTYTFTLKAGATTWATTSFAVSNASISNTVPWAFEFLIMCTAAGVSGTVEAQVQHGMTVQSTVITSVSNTASTATISFDTTSAPALTLNVVQTNDATTATTGRQWLVERLG